MFRVPVPAGPPERVRDFGLSDGTVDVEGLWIEGDGWGIEVEEGRSFRLFELEIPGLEQCFLTYRAMIKVEELNGRAFLEMWCRLPGGGEFFSKGFNNALTKPCDWVDCGIPFYLKKGQKPDLIRLNINIEGKGRLLIKDVELLQTPVSS